MPRFIVTLCSLACLFTAGIVPARAQMLPLLPNHLVTPGRAVDGITLHKICHTKWGKDARHVTAAMKRQVFANYGLTGNTDPACIRDAHGQRCEVDHLISRELGGADDVRNLWPQPYGSQPWNAVHRDAPAEGNLRQAPDHHARAGAVRDPLRLDGGIPALLRAPRAREKCTLRKD